MLEPVRNTERRERTGEASFLAATANRIRRSARFLLQPSRIHILFVVHNYAGLHNFDDCIRGFLRSGHRVTIALPEVKPGRDRRPREWRGGDVEFRHAPRTRGDRWELTANYIRKGRTYLLYRKSVFAQAAFLRDRVAETTPRSVKAFFEQSWVKRWPRLADLACRALEAGIPAAELARTFIKGRRSVGG